MLQSKDIGGWLDKNITHIYVVYKRLTSELKTHPDWKWGYGKRYFLQMETIRKQG